MSKTHEYYYKAAKIAMEEISQPGFRDNDRETYDWLFKYGELYGDILLLNWADFSEKSKSKYAVIYQFCDTIMELCLGFDLRYDVGTKKYYIYPSPIIPAVGVNELNEQCQNANKKLFAITKTENVQNSVYVEWLHIYEKVYDKLYEHFIEKVQLPKDLSIETPDIISFFENYISNAILLKELTKYKKPCATDDLLKKI